MISGPIGVESHLRPRTAFWATLAGTWLISVLWALGSPLMAAPDEPAHAAKAAAVVRGQLLGDEVGAPVGAGWVVVPDLFAEAQKLPGCFAYRPDVPANCSALPDSDLATPTRVLTSAVRYSPTYYLVAGLPSLWGSGPATLYAMRILSALLSSLMLALAVKTLCESKSSWLTLGTVVGLTPMVFFLNGSINPQSVEISSAVLVWVAAFAVIRAPTPDAALPLVRRLTWGAVFLLTTRSLGPLFFLVIIGVVGLLSSRSAVLAVLRFRRFWGWFAVMTVAAVAAVGWILAAGSLDTGPRVVSYPDLTGRQLTLKVLTDSWAYLQNALGVFGWNDTGLPGWGYLAVAAPITFVVIIGLSLAGWWQRSVWWGLLGLVIALPFVAQWNEARFINVFWQGRYSLPLAVGLPIVAGLLATPLGSRLPGWFTTRVTRGMLWVLAPVQTFAFAVNLRRNVNGETGGLLRPDADAWLPPVQPHVLLAAAAAGWAVLTVVWYRAALDRNTGQVPDEPPTRATA